MKKKWDTQTRSRLLEWGYYYKSHLSLLHSTLLWTMPSTNIASSSAISFRYHTWIKILQINAIINICTISPEIKISIFYGFFDIKQNEMNHIAVVKEIRTMEFIWISLSELQPFLHIKLDSNFVGFHFLHSLLRYLMHTNHKNWNNFA